MQRPGPSPVHSDATGRGLEGRGSLSFWEGDTPCAHAGPMHKAGKGAEATRGACILSLRARQQAWGHGVPALGTDSTQGDRGINDSFRHLHPSGDCSGGKSTRMTCVRSRSTEKGEMEREEMKRGTDPSTERDTEDPDVATWLPVHCQLGLPTGGVGFSGQAPARSRTSFPSPFPSGEDHVTTCRQQNVGKSHFRLAL